MADANNQQWGPGVFSPDLPGAEYDYNRQQQLANLLRQQATTPMATQSGVPTSPWSPLVQGLQGLAGGYMQNQARDTLTNKVVPAQRQGFMAQQQMIANMLRDPNSPPSSAPYDPNDPDTQARIKALRGGSDNSGFSQGGDVSSQQSSPMQQPVSSQPLSPIQQMQAAREMQRRATILQAMGVIDPNTASAIRDNSKWGIPDDVMKAAAGVGMTPQQDGTYYGRDANGNMRIGTMPGMAQTAQARGQAEALQRAAPIALTLQTTPTTVYDAGTGKNVQVPVSAVLGAAAGGKPFGSPDNASLVNITAPNGTPLAIQRGMFDNGPVPTAPSAFTQDQATEGGKHLNEVNASLPQVNNTVDILRQMSALPEGANPDVLRHSIQKLSSVFGYNEDLSKQQILEKLSAQLQAGQGGSLTDAGREIQKHATPNANMDDKAFMHVLNVMKPAFEDQQKYGATLSAVANGAQQHGINPGVAAQHFRAQYNKVYDPVYSRLPAPDYQSLNAETAPASPQRAAILSALKEQGIQSADAIRAVYKKKAAFDWLMNHPFGGNQ